MITDERWNSFETISALILEACKEKDEEKFIDGIKKMKNKLGRPYMKEMLETKEIKIERKSLRRRRYGS